jgi:inhibitor of KinA sporulation pathway (predicted exonuclease)
MFYIVFGLEVACWETGTSPERMETIEMGAAKLDPDTYGIIDASHTFVRPLK